MGTQKRALLAVSLIVIICSSYGARVIDKKESKRAAKEQPAPAKAAVQAASIQLELPLGGNSSNTMTLGWPGAESDPKLGAVYDQQQSFEQQQYQEYADQLAALATDNSVVQLSGAGMKNDVAIPLRGTVKITARDPWSPVCEDSWRRKQALSQNSTGGPTAYSYRGDLMCGLYNVGSCSLTGQLLPMQTMESAWDSLVVVQCVLNSNAGVYCDRQFRGGMTVQAEGLAAVTFEDDSDEIQQIDAMGLTITNIYYMEGPSNLIGGLMAAMDTTLGYKRGSLSLYAVDPDASGLYSGNATFNLEKGRA